MRAARDAQYKLSLATGLSGVYVCSRALDDPRFDSSAGLLAVAERWQGPAPCRIKGLVP